MTDSSREPLICPRCNKAHDPSLKECPGVTAGAEVGAGNASENEDSTRSVNFRNADAGLNDIASSGSDPLIGKVFAEKYDIVSLLGEGGMSKVYKARHKLMKRTVAVKLLHESATRDETAKARFQQEAEAASALSHQNVVTVHDFGFTDSGHAFFVMDCLEGRSLEELLMDAQTLPLARIIEIFTQGCDGLEHAHRKGIIHRDIKPSNLVIIKQEDGSDLVKLVDFGIAKVLTPAAEGERRQLTQTGEVFGTPAYMSPEQCNGTQLDKRTDLYSFGCMMYEALSGEPPFLGNTFINTIVKQLNEAPKSFAEKAPNVNVPPAIEAVVMKCLEKNPEDRYGSAQELKQALYDAAFVSGVKGLRVGAVPEPGLACATTSPVSEKVALSERKQTTKWRLTFAATLAAVVAAGAAISAWLFCYPGPESDRGIPFNKIMWRYRISAADGFMGQQKYNDAIRELENARVLAKDFGDENASLDHTLEKLGDAYGKTGKYDAQEEVNKKRTLILNEKVFKEYEHFMSLLKEWSTPLTSSVANQERALQASACAEQLLICADKLSIRSKDREERLLKNAIAVFDSMESKNWKYCVQFRLALVECYRSQQRFDDMRAVLNQCMKLCPDDPGSPDGWRAKIQTMMFAGQLDRNVAKDTTQIDKARQELETVLKLVRTHLPNDRELLKDALGSAAIVNRLYHTKEYDDKAATFEKEARSLEQ